MHRPLFVLLLTAVVAACSNGANEFKVGGAWPSAPVKCSAYAEDRAAHAACLERDRQAERGSGGTQLAIPPSS